MKLKDEFFIDTLRGNKTIEFRLNDSKRKKIKIGDQVIFKNRHNEISVFVTNLYYGAKFDDLIKKIDQSKINYSDQYLLDTLNSIYSIDDQLKYGTVAIEFRLL